MRSVVVAILVAAAARTAAADPPTAATRALMTQLGDGTVPAASLIDPATGAWILEGDRATHVCGTTALLELAVEVRVHAATWGADAGCANHADDAGCDLPERVDAVPFDGYTLRFDRSARGLVLRALVRGEASAKATIDRGAQCTGAAPLPAEPPNANGHPVVTVAMVRALARGAAKLDPLIDRERGLTIVSEQPAADDDSHDRDERICNRAAIRRELRLPARADEVDPRARSERRRAVVRERRVDVDVLAPRDRRVGRQPVAPLPPDRSRARPRCVDELRRERRAAPRDRAAHGPDGAGAHPGVGDAVPADALIRRSPTPWARPCRGATGATRSEQRSAS